MLVVETIAGIRRDHLGRGIPIKQIVRDLKLSRNTVRKEVGSDETSLRYERSVQPLPKLGPLGRGTGVVVGSQRGQESA